MIPSLFLLDFPRAYALVSLSPWWLALLSPAPVRACYLQSPCPLLPSLSLCLPQPWSLRSSPTTKMAFFSLLKNKRSLYFLPMIPVTFSFFSLDTHDSCDILLFTLDITSQCLSWVPSCAQLLNVWLSRAQSWTLYTSPSPVKFFFQMLPNGTFLIRI